MGLSFCTFLGINDSLAMHPSAPLASTHSLKPLHNWLCSVTCFVGNHPQALAGADNWKTINNQKTNKSKGPLFALHTVHDNNVTKITTEI